MLAIVHSVLEPLMTIASTASSTVTYFYDHAIPKCICNSRLKQLEGMVMF